MSCCRDAYQRNRSQTAIVSLEDVELQATFTYYPPQRGARDRYGVPLEPDEPDSIEVEAVKVGGVDIIGILTEAQLAEIEAQIRRKE